MLVNQYRSSRQHEEKLAASLLCFLVPIHTIYYVQANYTLLPSDPAPEAPASSVCCRGKDGSCSGASQPGALECGAKEQAAHVQNCKAWINILGKHICQDLFTRVCWGFGKDRILTYFLVPECFIENCRPSTIFRTSTKAIMTKESLVLSLFFKRE